MSTDDDELGWLDNSDDEGGGAGEDAKSAAPPENVDDPAPATVDDESEDDLQDALNWLQSSDDDDGDTSEEGSGEGGEALDWLGGGEAGDANNALLPDDEEDEAEDPSQSIFSSALDDFFDGLGDEEEEGDAADEGSQTVVTRAGRRPARERIPAHVQRIDKVMNTLVRYLTRKDAIRESQLDTVFKLTVGKIVDPISAEVVVVYFLDDDGASIFGHMFYSRTLFREKPQLEQKFKSGVETLGKLKIAKGEGIVGRALSSNKSITSLDASRDSDFQNHLGKATGYKVRTMLTVPIADDGEHYGAIQVMNKDPQSGEEFFSYQDLKLIEEIARYLGRLIHITRDPELERSEDEMTGYIAKLAKTTVFNFAAEDNYWDDRLWEVVGHEDIVKYNVLPLRKLDSKSLEVVMVNPLDPIKKSGFEAATELQIGKAFVATESAIKAFLAEKLGLKPEDSNVDDGEFGDLKASLGAGGGPETVEMAAGESENDHPVIKLVNRIIEDAYSHGASDIHIEPYETYARVRYRVDGTLSERMRLPSSAINSMMSRIKIMCDLDIAERRLPQDGKIKFKQFTSKDIDIDLRVATGPMAWGEKCVMRILAKGSISLGLEVMGFAEQNMTNYRWGLSQPYGMILNVGPTGSGKTTTLYSGLSEMNDVSINIQTAEDPIEYPLEGINQMQMQKQIGLDFSRALRCYMRMDPDVILVGEIRDLETAEIAVEASLTGHVLFSTLHTNDAAGTCTRFIEMGIEPFMISSSLLVCCAQRLLRRTCPKCRIPWTPNEKELELLRWDPRDIPSEGMFRGFDNRKGKGKKCKRCGGVGYKGRCGTHETLRLNDELRHLINTSASSNIIKSAAMRNGMTSIYQDALFKVKEGTTDLPDALARVKADEKDAMAAPEVGANAAPAKKKKGHGH
ncbi:ATPase, T2SS/T4P/T4SS family [Planctomycetota bacterium]|nr:ATPase, T2SS/T4P/T4SS family [Planctomycetota bacterium]